jgi:hypothetical protein
MDSKAVEVRLTYDEELKAIIQAILLLELWLYVRDIARS